MKSRAWSYRGSHGTLLARTWTARDSQPSHIALIAHGYREHIGCYDRVAEAFVRNGAMVYGVDHLRQARATAGVF